MEPSSEETAARVRAAERVVACEIEALEEVRRRLGPDFARAVDMVLETEGRVVTTGMGKAGIIARKVSATLASTGTPSIYIHPAEARHGDLGRICQGDLLLALSKSGETEEVLLLIPAVRAAGVRVLAMTESRDSDLGRVADLVLELGPISEAGSMGLAPTASTAALMALGDALALVVQEGRGFGPEDFARFHPGGSLGRRLLKVEEIMRRGERNPLVRANATIRETLVVMTKTPGRPGAAVVVGDDGRLLGIFTDGDLRRSLDGAEEGFLERRVSEFMTKDPKRIGRDKLAADALSLLHEHRIDQAPVVDEEGRAVGLVDVQDLLELKIA